MISAPYQRRRFSCFVELAAAQKYGIVATRAEIPLDFFCEIILPE